MNTLVKEALVYNHNATHAVMQQLMCHTFVNTKGISQGFIKTQNTEYSFSTFYNISTSPCSEIQLHSGWSLNRISTKLKTLE